MRTVENDIPEIFLELAREAIGLGISEVNLGFMYMDAGFVSPIEWGLWLTKREHGSAPDEYLLLTMGRSEGETEPTAYIPSSTGDPFAGTYWGPEEVRAWMKEPLEAEGEYVPAWMSVEDPETQGKLLAQWPLFEMGVRSGWTMKRKVDWTSRAIFKRSMERSGGSVADDVLPPMNLGWSITNSFYNAEGHPDHRDTGASISVSGWGLISYGEEQFNEHIRAEDGRPAISRLSREQVEETLGTNHPWFVRVAYNDEEQEDWLHFPEALQAPEQTIDPSKF